MIENKENYYLQLMYITNRPFVAKTADESGVDIIFIDLETIGKFERQKNLDTVKSQHSLEDIALIKNIIKKAKIMVRINPFLAQTKYEIDTAIENGADSIMLPMFKTAKEVQEFIKLVGGRAETVLLLETVEALNNLDDILKIKGIGRIHIGLNDLHLAQNKHFMFELLVDGTVAHVIEKIKPTNIPFGVGGIARVGLGLVPSEYIIREHHNIGSKYAILSRSFCNADKSEDFDNLKTIFHEGIKNIRSAEEKTFTMTKQDFAENYEILKSKIQSVVDLKKTS